MPKPQEIAPGLRVLRTVQECLKLGDRAIRRCVLDIDVSGAVKVYLEEFVTLDMVGALVGELPNIRPDVQWMDKIEVANHKGSEIVIRELKPDDPEERELRELTRAFLDHFRRAPLEEREAIKDMVYGVEGTV